jgi:CheY-like chemotaxis protein
MKILIIDDHETVRRTLGQALEDAFESTGTTVMTESDGAAGLERFKSDAEIRLVFLDINMPEMDGRRVLDAIRTMPRGKSGRTKVFVMSYAGKTVADECRSIGIDGWLMKPIKPRNVAQMALGVCLQEGWARKRRMAI